MSLFTFRQRYGNLDWTKIEALNIDELISNSNLGTLQELVDSVTFSDVTAKDLKDASKGALLNLIHISQLMLEYLLTGQEQQAEQIQSLYYKHSAIKQKCKKLETSNVRLREDLSVYKHELSVLQKMQGKKKMDAYAQNTGDTGAGSAAVALLGNGSAEEGGGGAAAVPRPREAQPPRVIRGPPGGTSSAPPSAPAGALSLTNPAPEVSAPTSAAASEAEGAGRLSAHASTSASAEEKSADGGGAGAGAGAASQSQRQEQAQKGEEEEGGEDKPPKPAKPMRKESISGDAAQETLTDSKPRARKPQHGQRRTAAHTLTAADLEILRAEAEAEGLHNSSSTGSDDSDDSGSGAEQGDDVDARGLAPVEQAQALEKVLGHHDIDLKLHIARLFEQQRELIEQKVIRKEDALQMQLEGMQGNSQQVQMKELCSRVDQLAELMQATLGALQHGQVAPSSSAASVTASPFRKKSRGTPDTSVDGVSVLQDVHGGSSSSTGAGGALSSNANSAAGKVTIGDYLQQAAEELYEEEVEFDIAKQRNNGLSRREAAIAAREAAIEDRESHVRIREQGIKASLAKLDIERDALEVSKAIAYRASPERTASTNTGNGVGAGVGSSPDDFEFTLSPSPSKDPRASLVPDTDVKSSAGKTAATAQESQDSPQNMPPAKKPKRPSTTSMATSTSALESVKEAELKDAAQKELKRKLEMAAKIVMARIGQAQRFRVNRGFRKWLDKTVDAREAENYHYQFEAERKAEVSAALLARGREKEKQLSEQLKLERQQLKKKDEEMKQRLDAERQREKERYEAILFEADPERAAAQKTRRASAVLLEGATRTSQEASALLAAVEQEDATKRQMKRDELTNADKGEEGSKAKKEELGKAVEAFEVKQDVESLIANDNSSKPSKPSRSRTSSLDAKPGKPTRTKSADNIILPAANSSQSTSKSSRPSKSEKGRTTIKSDSPTDSPADPVSLTCVFEHGANVRDSPTKSAKTIGEIDKGHVVPGTGKTHVELNGLMYVELAKSPQHPEGGWVPVRTHGGQAVMQEHTKIVPASAEKLKSNKKSILRYRCIFTHGAFVRNTPSRNAENIGEIDENDVVHVTGKVETDTEGSGITFVQLEVSEAHPNGGWVPIVSKTGNTVMEPFAGTPERAATPVQSDSGKSASNKSKSSKSGRSDSGKSSHAGGRGDDDLLVDELLEDVEDLNYDEAELFERAQQRIAAGSSGKHSAI